MEGTVSIIIIALILIILFLVMWVSILIPKKNKKKKLFVSQPMRYKTDKEILETRQLAIEDAEYVLGEEVELIDSFFQSAPHDANPLWYLGQSLLLLSKADVVYFAKGWNEARGCIIEHKCACDYGMFIITHESRKELANA